MQPKRDPNDIRFWPQSEGGTGFHRDPKTAPRYRFAALAPARTRKHMSLPSIVAAADYSPDTVRSRARAALLLAVERLHDAVANEDNVLAVNELTQIAGTLGRISGVQTTNVEVSGSVAHMHLDALREITQRATARIALPDPAQPVDAQPVDAQHVSADTEAAENEGRS